MIFVIINCFQRNWLCSRLMLVRSVQHECAKITEGADQTNVAGFQTRANTLFTKVPTISQQHICLQGVHKRLRTNYWSWMRWSHSCISTESSNVDNFKLLQLKYHKCSISTFTWCVIMKPLEFMWSGMSCIKGAWWSYKMNQMSTCFNFQILHILYSI